VSALLAFLKSHTAFLIFLGVFSVVAFFGTILLLPFLIIRIPEDYFLDEKHPPAAPPGHPLWRKFLKLVKNLLGFIFILAGLVMLVVPGQGILTILIGLIMIDFPGKRKLECRLIRNPSVLKAVNYIRARAGKNPLKTSALPSSSPF